MYTIIFRTSHLYTFMRIAPNNSPYTEPQYPGYTSEVILLLTGLQLEETAYFYIFRTLTIMIAIN
jgi:hypothetical protein